MACAIGSIQMNSAPVWSRVRQRRIGAALAFIVIAALACSSNDTLFIQLTATPFPSATPTLSAVSSRFKPGDRAVFVAAPSPATLLASPRPNDKSSGANLCFTSTQVDVLETAQTDGKTYYRIKCASAHGWTPETTLTGFIVGDNAVLAIDAYLTNDPEPDAKSKRADLKPCKMDAAVGILDLAMTAADQTIYVQVQCGSVVGWLPQAALR